MTKDEAIKIIQTEMECVSRPDCDRLACAYCDLAMRAGDILTAYQMAIEALQTDGDCISRRAILDMLGADDAVSASDIDKLSDVGVAILTARLAMIKAVLALPSVQPEERTEERTETHACDCISRRVALDAIIAKLDAIDHVPQWVFDELTGVIGELSPVQPDNSCDGCKYEDVDDGVLVPCGYCGRSHPDNYERRTDD